MYPFEKIENFLKKLESCKTPTIYFILTFFFAVTIRNFLEVFSYDPTILVFRFFLHYYLFYVSIVLSLIIIFHFVTMEDIEKVARVILSFSPIIIVAPIIDLIVGSFRATYILPEHHGNLLARFLQFGGTFTNFGITTGIRIELILVIFLCFVYFLFKSNLFRSLISVFPLYTLFFFYGTSPYTVKLFLNLFGIGYKYSPSLMSNFHLLCILILSGIIFLVRNRENLFETLRSIPTFRLIHFELMFILGITLTGRGILETLLNLEKLFAFPLVISSIFFAGLFSLLVNNIEDRVIDRDTRQGNIFRGDSWSEKANPLLLTLVFTLVCALAVNFKTLFIIILGIGIYFLYSAPPLRLKRIPLLSKFLIAFNSLITLMVGFVFAGGRIVNFPTKVIFFFLIFYTLAMNFIDLKDYREDRKAAIKTLPVILGLRKSKLVIAIFFLIAYLVAPLVFTNSLVTVLAPIPGIIGFFAILKKKYEEKYVFIPYLLSITLLILLV